jgi:hypothetical protein
VLPDKLELLKKVPKSFFVLSQTGQWRTAGVVVVTLENFRALLQYFPQESKFLLARETSKIFWKVLKFNRIFKKGAKQHLSWSKEYFQTTLQIGMWPYPVY